MKKLILIFLSVALIATATACGGNDGGKKITTLNVNEVTHSIFYAPFYVAIEAGFFEENGIKIELTNGGGSDASMAALLSGSADVALLGPETGIYTALGNTKDQPVIFAQLTKRDGSFLMGRHPEPDFEWEDLEGKEIIAGRKGGSPAMSLEFALNKNGLYNGNNVTLNFDVQFNLTTAAFESGTGDYVTVFEPTASEMQRNGKGYIITSVGEESGEVPFTCFMVRSSYFKKHKDVLEKFNTALMQAIKYIDEQPVEKVAEVLEGAFPSTSARSITDSLISYKSIDAWKKDLVMTKDAFLHLEEVMQNAGELDGEADYGTLVKNEIAEQTYLKIFG